MAIQCDVYLYFGGGQPSRLEHIWHARDEEHAKKLALMNAQAKGWNIKLIVPCDIIVKGVLPA